MESNLTPKVAKFLDSQIMFRPAQQADVNFIFNSWLKSNRNSPTTINISNPVYFAQHHLLVEGICRNSSVLVACNAQDQAQIYGYVAHQDIEGVKAIHYVYVKEPYRRLGLGKLLLEQINVDPTKPFFITHRARVLQFLERKYAFIFNPYLAYYGHEIGRQVKADQLEAYKEHTNTPRSKELQAEAKQLVAETKVALGLDPNQPIEAQTDLQFPAEQLVITKR